MQKNIIFTDLDGTLLEHHTYSFDAAQPALHQIKKYNIPLIFCTSKTKAEILYWQQKIGNTHPFISENGGGIYIPHQYFDFNYTCDATYNGYNLIKFGISYQQLIQAAVALKKQFKITSFAEMSTTEISEDTGLPLEQAALAKQRDFELPLKFLEADQTNDILSAIKKMDLFVMSGGRYHHIMGHHNKGTAVRRLLQLYSKKYPSFKSIALGDSQNDLSMLDEVDIPIVVQRPDGSYISSKYQQAPGIGPQGWCSAVTDLIK
ncbi:MAG: HAD-IIB family hydrolase [Candidatus Thermoplasmatota archaeon]|nr:HAD-IIB family hydrolase [Candidatus Thermoplasmatota archaeon]MBU1941539.1 HAD-IIB family hydrolase [Candidatus Thermoplasmatota archaeon]